MNASLFDMVRSDDPETSHLAAKAVAPGCKECIDAIRRALSKTVRPKTAFQIAALVEADYPNRWDEGTVRRRVKDAGLTKVDKLGKSPRGQFCDRFTL